MANSVFIIGDGDGIRKNIDRYLFNNELSRLTDFSASLTNSISEIALVAKQTMNAEIIYAGGDDIFFIVDLDDYQESKIQQLMNVFIEKTGCSISFGIGLSVQEAFINLRLAKADDKRSVISSLHKSSKE